MTTSLSERYLPLAYGIARSFRWPGADRDDVRQEAATALLHAERSWDRRGSFVSFARVVVRRHLLDCARLAERRPALVELPDLEADEPTYPRALAAREGTVEDVVLRRERLRLVLEAPLSPRERRVLALVAQGYPLDEIGEALDLSAAVAKWTTWRARTRLREQEAA